MPLCHFPTCKCLHLSAKDILVVGGPLEHTPVQTPLYIRTQGFEPVPQQLHLYLGDFAKYGKELRTERERERDRERQREKGGSGPQCEEMYELTIAVYIRCHRHRWSLFYLRTFEPTHPVDLQSKARRTRFLRGQGRYCFHSMASPGPWRTIQLRYPYPVL